MTISLKNNTIYPMKYIKFIVIFTISLALLFFFFKNVNISQVIRIIKQVNPIYPLVFAIGSFLQFFIRAYRWGIILKPYKDGIALSTLYNFTVIGYLINFLIPGRVGEPAKGILLARHEHIPPSSGLASVVLERLIDFFVIVVFFLVSLSYVETHNSKFLNQIKHIILYMLPAIILIFFMFYVFNNRRILPIVEKIIDKMFNIFPKKIGPKLTGFAVNFIKGLQLNLRFVDAVKLFIVSILVWLSLIPCYWFLLKGFGIHLGLFEVLPYFSIIVISASIPTPGMAGTIDAGSKIALTNLYHIPADTAVAFTILFHFLVLLVWTVFGIIAITSQGLSLKNLKKIKELKKNEMS